MTNPSYTRPVIKGVKCAETLPRGFALALEGGGTRGFFSAGVMDAFLKESVMFPYIVGVSAGCANALSYVAGQYGRNREIAERYVCRHEYVSKRNLLKYGSLFGYDYIFKTIPNRHIFWDREMFEACPARFLTGATDCVRGETVWFEKEDVDGEFTASRASCSVPFAAKPVKFKGMTLLDGGILAPIPIEKSLEDGNSFHVIVLTRNKGYVKPPFKGKIISKLFYGKYPKLREALLNRHEVYNRQSALCEELEKSGRALIIRPEKPLEFDRTGNDSEKLLRLYDEGEREGLRALKVLRGLRRRER
ncbi:MAG: patatin family protein [Oscillospiraceae bacterium]|jgi:predicted patatin/cPLA2 family phospholipase|nr:patatin family protein [Oscillospiraceae bacterium]